MRASSTATGLGVQTRAIWDGLSASTLEGGTVREAAATSHDGTGENAATKGVMDGGTLRRGAGDGRDGGGVGATYKCDGRGEAASRGAALFIGSNVASFIVGVAGATVASSLLSMRRPDTRR